MKDGIHSSASWALSRDAIPADASARRTERVTIVRTLDDLQRVAAIRAIVYVDGQDCPYGEEFDGNDLCGLHLLGWVGGEPAATLRLRFFGGFAKLERLAVRAEHRRSSIAFRLVREALRIARRKGFAQAYGHARSGLEPFWERFGARRIGPAGGFGFSGRRYTEMLLDLAPAADALRIGADPLVLIRPEGAWDAPGVLEGAGARDANAAPPGLAAAGWSPSVRAAWAPFAGGRMPGLEEEASAFLGPPPGDAGAPPLRRRHRRRASPVRIGPKCARPRRRWRGLAGSDRGIRAAGQSQTRTRRMTTVS
jgi:predicted GNAT family N-acyltransferase